MFIRIDHIAFVVKDREKSIKFYEGYFGFRKYYEHDVPVPTIEKIVYLKLGDTVLDYKRLKGIGVPVETEPHAAGAREPREEGWRRVVFKGPDGESIEFRG